MAKSRLVVFALLLFGTVALPRAYGFSPTLGDAASFSALSTTESIKLKKHAELSAGIGGGTSVSLHRHAFAGGDVVAETGGISLGKDAAVNGTCVTSGFTEQITLGPGADCFTTDESGFNADLTTFTQAVTELASFETSLAGQATQTLGPLTVAKNGTATITGTVTGVNVVSISSITIKKGATLNLSGDASDIMILDISGALTVHTTAQIVLVGGLTASQVILNVRTGDVSLPQSFELDGTLIAAEGKCTLDQDDDVVGAVVCNKKITLNKRAKVTFAAFSSAIPPTAWNVTGSLNVGRALHTQTTLEDGTVLVTGGLSNGDTTVEKTAELYDSSGTTASFTTGNMATARWGHTATLLQSGKVLIVGGADINENSLSSAELYDPSTGTFSATGSLREPLAFHTATLLPDGRVLIAGGDSPKEFLPTADAEIYDPVTGTFSGTTNKMSVARDWFVTGLFTSGPLSGQVIVAGGNVGAPTATADLFDPSSNRFKATGRMAVARAEHIGAIVTVGSQQEFLVAGGGPASVDDGATSELYDPATGAFSTTDKGLSLTSAHLTGTSTELPSGLVVLAGGANLPSGFLTDITNFYDPTTGTYLNAPRMQQFREWAAASLLQNGQVLETGGFIGGPICLSEAELLQ
jgi:hypothetical protein